MNFKRILYLFIEVAVLSCLLFGCGSDTPTERSDSPVSDSSAPSNAVQPTLTDTLQRVCDLGIADIEVLSRAGEICSREEAVEMLARVHESQFGVVSQYLTDPNVVGENEAATRYFFAQALYFSAMETIYDAPYENYNDWINYCIENERPDIWPDSQVIAPNLDGSFYGGGVWDICPDLNEIDQPDDTTELRFGIDFGSSPGR